MAITFNNLQYPSYIFSTTGGGTVFSANQTANTAFDYFSDTAVVNDAIYFSNIGHECFKGLQVTVGTAMAGTGITLVWEYYKPSAWYALSGVVDNTSGFTVAGTNDITWDIPSGWYRRVINSQEKVWVRCRISALTTITEGGANATNRVQEYDYAIQVTGYSSSTPCTMLDIYNADVAGGWGMVTKAGDYAYNVASNLRIGDGSTASYLTIKSCAVVFDYHIKVLTNGYWVLGELIDKDDGRAKNGAFIYQRNLATSGFQNPSVYGTTGLVCYDSVYLGLLSDVYIGESIGCNFQGGRIIAYETHRRNNYYLQLWVGNTSTVLDDIFIHTYAGGAIRCWTSSAADMIASNPKIRNCTYILIFEGTNTHYQNYYLRNADTDTWDVGWGYGGAPYNQTLHRQYSVDILVLDEKNLPLEGATVKMENAAPAQVFSVVTDSLGAIATQYVTSHSYTYSAGTVDTDFNPFTLTVSMPGYETYKTVATFEEKINMKIKLRQSLSAGRDDMGTEFK